MVHGKKNSCILVYDGGFERPMETGESIPSKMFTEFSNLGVVESVGSTVAKEYTDGSHNMTYAIPSANTKPLVPFPALRIPIVIYIYYWNVPWTGSKGKMNYTRILLIMIIVKQNCNNHEAGRRKEIIITIMLICIS